MKYGGGTGTFTEGPTIQGFPSNRHHCPSDGLTGINLTGTIPFFYLSAFLGHRRHPAATSVRPGRRRKQESLR
jgi:hypothetical protein